MRKFEDVLGWTDGPVTLGTIAAYADQLVGSVTRRVSVHEALRALRQLQVELTGLGHLDPNETRMVECQCLAAVDDGCAGAIERLACPLIRDKMEGRAVTIAGGQLVLPYVGEEERRRWCRILGIPEGTGACAREAVIPPAEIEALQHQAELERRGH